MDVCNNILCFIYILLETIAVSYILNYIFDRIRIGFCCRYIFLLYLVIPCFILLCDIKYARFITPFVLIFICIVYLFIREDRHFVMISKNIMNISIILLIISLCYLSSRLMVHKFNGDSWWINENNISDDINKWGDFATFFGGIFALISIYLAYRAFMSQVNASKRTSFDVTFTQIFAKHHVLHDKVLKHDIAFISRYDLSYVVNENNNIFAICRNEFTKYRPVFDTILDSEFWNCLERATQRRISDNVRITIINRINIRQFWRCFNRIIGLEASIDFKNYFKYIYHEINIVVSQLDEVLNDNAKRNYIQLIQAQMNYDELFCYFINQVEYLSYWRTHRERNEAAYNEAITHAANLRSYGFFYELCKSRSGHVNLVRDISRYNNEEVSRLINVNWIPLNE